MRRRIDELRRAGLLYFDIDIDDAVLGVSAHLMLWLKIEPASLDAAGRAIAAHGEIPFAAATTGPTNLAVSAVFRDTAALYAYLTTRLADLPGLQSVETAPIIGTLEAHRLSSLAGQYRTESGFPAPLRKAERRERPPRTG